MDIQVLWRAIIEQRADALRTFFHEDAHVNWPCTNERFTVEEYIRANCEYPGRWRGEIERIEEIGELTILVGRICSEDETWTLHVVSFIRTRDDRIASMDEYFADDGDAPQWRLDMNIGTPIR